jgi:hypothetical protein
MPDGLVILEIVEFPEFSESLSRRLSAGATGDDSFHKLRRWNNGCLQRMVQHLAEGHPLAYEKLQSEALERIDLGLASPEETEALRLQIAYYRYQYCGMFEPPGAHRAAWRRMQRILVEPAHTELAERLRQRLYLKLLCKGDLLEYCDLGETDLARRMDGIAEADRNPELWFCVSAWAFKHEIAMYVEQAYSSLLVHPRSYLATPSWLRVNLMLLLLEQRASELDVLSYVEAIRIRALLDEFHSLLLPRIKSAGLLSERLLESLMFCQARLEQNSAAGLYETPTRRIRTGI